jgi:hypothetical protein
MSLASSLDHHFGFDAFRARDRKRRSDPIPLQ